MESSNQETQKSTVTNKSGLHVCGYIVPWWLVIVILVVLAYVIAQHYGYASMGTTNTTTVNLNPVIKPLPVVSSPEGILPKVTNV